MRALFAGAIGIARHTRLVEPITPELIEQ
jgi:hypothetical protein